MDYCTCTRILYEYLLKCKNDLLVFIESRLLIFKQFAEVFFK